MRDYQIVDSVEKLEQTLKRVKAAQKKYAEFSQEQVDKIFFAAAVAANSQRIPLAKMAVSETGMGVVEDKVIKNHYASEYIYNAYKDVKTCGVIEEDKAQGMKKIAEPLGVIAAVIPTTNPTSTAIFKTLIALKTRNAIIISPHPRAKNSTITAAKVVLEAAIKAGRFFAVMGIEGLSGIEGDIEQINTLYDLGFRHASLTWNEENHLAAGAAIEDGSKGVTALGEKAIKLMDDLGMIFDVSHLNERSFWEVTEIWKKPMIASHSNSKAILPHRRNITDEQAKAISKSGGVIGVNACGEFLHKNKPHINCYLDNIEHFVNVAGLEAVGIGFDFCDFLRSGSLGSDEKISKGVEGLEDVRTGGAVLEGLKSRGFSGTDIEKIAHGNFLRVIREIIY